MAFNGFLAQVADFITSDKEVDDAVPCKSDILTFRDCVKGASKEVRSAIVPAMVFLRERIRGKFSLCPYPSRNAKVSSWI